MNLPKEDWALIKQSLIVLDRLGNFGRAPSELLYKLEQEFKNEQTSLREQILKLEKALDKACEELESFCLTYESRGFQEPFTKEEWKEWLR